MPDFKITGPDGKAYKVSGENAEGAYAALQTMLGGKGEAAPAEPAKSGADKFYSNMNASASGFLEGIPIIGPALNTGADYVEAALRPNSTIEDVQKKEAQDLKDNPGTAIAGNVAGGLYSGIAAGPMAGATRVGQALAAAPRLARVGAGLLAGSALGGTDAAVRGQDIGMGAIGGGIGGAAGPVIGDAVGNVVGRIANRGAQNAALRGTGVDPEVARILLNAGRADDALGGAGTQRIARAGPGGMLADSGPATQAVLDTALARGDTEGARLASQRIGQRVDASGQDVVAGLDQHLGTPEGVHTTSEASKAGARPINSANYDKAYAQPIDYAGPHGMAIEAQIKNQVPGSAITAANKLMRVEGAKSKQILANIADDGTVTFQSMPDVMQVDYITRALRDEAKTAGFGTSEGRALNNLARSIRGSLGDAVPDFKTASASARDPIVQREALEFGAKLLKPNMPRDVARAEILGMDGAQVSMAKQGVRSDIDEIMSNVKSTLSNPDENAVQQAIKAVKDLSSQANREKIEMLMTPREADDLFGRLDRAAQSLQLRASVAKNSRTYGRQAVDESIKQMSEPGMVGKLMQGKPLQAGQAATQLATGMTPERAAARQQEVFSGLADLLTRPNAIPLLQQFERAARIQGRGNTLSRLVAPRVAAGTGLASLGLVNSENR